MLFVLTVDTEADNQWNHGVELTTENVRHWEPFQRVCRQHGIAPTYLVTSEIAADPPAREKLTSWVSEGHAEVGAHLHPWTTPPFVDRPGFRYNDSAHAFLSELPQDLVRLKLERLTEEIAGAFGVRPTSFRAGRYGFDFRCAEVLAELGYHVDCSVTPMTELRSTLGLAGGRGGPDFSKHSAQPFIIEGTGSPGLVEMPVTILPTYPVLRRSQALLRAYRSLPVRVLRRAVLSRWLSPQPVWLQASPWFKEDDLRNVFSCQRQVASVAVMIVHSSELMPGGSPFWPDEAAVQDLLGILDRFLDFVQASGAVSATLSEAASALRSTNDLRTLPL
jgi:hypothetical protein